MIDILEILEASGLPYRKTKYVSPPKAASYLVWSDERSNIGPDMCPSALREHSITIELYEYKPDETAEAQLEAVLDAACIEWSCSDRIWIEKEQIYEVVYSFKFTEKRS